MEQTQHEKFWHENSTLQVQHTEVNIEIQRTNSSNCKIEIQHDKIDL